MSGSTVIGEIIAPYAGDLSVTGIQTTGDTAVIDISTPPPQLIEDYYYAIEGLVGPTLTIATVDGPEVYSGISYETDNIGYGTSTVAFDYTSLTGIPIVLSNNGTDSHATLDDASVTPFSGVAVSGFDDGLDLDTLTVTPNKLADGKLSDPDGGQVVNGSYVLTGTPSTLQTALDALVFTPTEHQVSAGKTVTTDFAISVSTPAAISGQPCVCGSVGPSGKRRANHSATAGWKPAPGSLQGRPTLGDGASSITPDRTQTL